jgi:TPP-dependent pyruvate/acetoin dehydrogenase alpha subunit
MSEAIPDSPVLVEIFQRMARIKLNDDLVIKTMRAGRLSMPYYSARGQECIPAAISVQLSDDDYLVTIYRGIHDMLAKGLPPKLMWAELAGRITGTCKGKGGPMHLTYPSKGCMVTTGIVGASLPIACGLAMASQVRGEQRVTIASFGDGASNIGAFHESLNLASVWKLPVIFVCQNNQYAEHTDYAKATAVARVADRAASYSMPGVHVDGNDPLAVHAAARAAIARARSGGGPTLIEALTFRFNGHLIGDDGSYIPKPRYQAAMEADPYPRYREWLVREKHGTAAQLDAIEAELAQEAADAAEFALASAEPGAEEMLLDIYATT